MILYIENTKDSTKKLLALINESEKAMAPHFSTLAWKIPWMEEPDGLQSMGSLRVGHDFTLTFTKLWQCKASGCHQQDREKKN